MSAGPMQTNEILSPVGPISEAQHRYLELRRLLMGLDEHIHADRPRSDPEERGVRLDTNGRPLRDWDD
jgi:hypothetical protein